MRINKDTKIFGSFAKEAGNNGCKMFNSAFLYHNIDAIYKSFSVDNIEDAFNAAKTLDFKGFAITMPYKKEILNYVDSMSEDVKKIGAANTVIKEENKWVAYNTDYLAAYQVLSETLKNFKPADNMVYVLGNGGYSAAVQYAIKKLKLDCTIISRRNWYKIEDIEYSIIYNCTPVSNIKINNNNAFIDCLINTNTGFKLSLIQANYQFKLYTGLELPFLNLINEKNEEL